MLFEDHQLAVLISGYYLMKLEGNILCLTQYWLYTLPLSHCFSDAPLREYRNETVVLLLPAEITVHSIDWFSVWDVVFRISFGELQLPDNITFTTPEPPGRILCCIMLNPCVCVALGILPHNWEEEIVQV